MTNKPIGWYRESERHALASRGVKTTLESKGRRDSDESEEVYDIELRFDLEELCDSFGLPSPYLDPVDFYSGGITQEYIDDARDYHNIPDEVPDDVISNALWNGECIGFGNEYYRRIVDTLKERIMEIMGYHYEYDDYDTSYAGDTSGIEDIEVQGGEVVIQATSELKHTINAMIEGYGMFAIPDGEHPEVAFSSAGTLEDYFESHFFWLNEFYDIYGATKPTPDLDGIDVSYYFDNKAFKDSITSEGYEFD